MGGAGHDANKTNKKGHAAMTHDPISPTANTLQYTISPDCHDPPALTVDLDEFIHFLEDTNWSEDQKAEYLQTLWGIMVSFAAMGFGLHPVQPQRSEDEEACGQLPKPPAPHPNPAANAVN